VTVLGRSLPIIGAGAYQHLEVYAKAGNGTVGRDRGPGRRGHAAQPHGHQHDRRRPTSSSASGVRPRIGSAPTPMIDFADCYCNDTVADGSGCDSFVGDCKSGGCRSTATPRRPTSSCRRA
jgi:hypothetical protein